MDITVHNKHHGKPLNKGFYIGRGSPLGNPFSHQRGTAAKFVVSTRDEAVDLYGKYLEAEYKNGNQRIIDALHELHEAALQEPISLICFCAPQRCHGDFIRKILLNNIAV